MKEKPSYGLKRITLKQLHAFTATMQTGTKSGAARLLHVTPPAINLQLRLLEENVGLPLFDRSDEGICPTAVGYELLDTAARIEETIVEFGATLDAFEGLDIGHIHVGVVSTAKYYAPRALAAFVKLHPNVDLRLRVGNRGEMLAGLKHFDLDFVIMGLPPDDIAVEKVAIADHPHIIIAQPGHPAARRKKIALMDLAEETFLLREEESGTRILMQRLFDDAGLNPNLGMEIGSNETIKQAVIAGLGVALISAHTVHAELQDGRLTELDVVGLPVMRQWFVTKMKKKRLLPAARALWDFIVNSGSRYLPGETA